MSDAILRLIADLYTQIETLTGQLADAQRQIGDLTREQASTLPPAPTP